MKNGKKKTRAMKIAEAEAANTATKAPEALKSDQDSAQAPEQSEALSAQTDVTSPLASAVKEAMKDETPMFELQVNAGPLTEEAYDWMSDAGSIPGSGFAPLRFVGRRTLDNLTRILGRQITLQEAQVLVQKDGNETVCAATGIKFQPVKYWPYASKYLQDYLAAGMKFEDMDIPYGGCYYLDKNGKILAFSGSVYGPNKIDYSHSSPIVMAAKASADKTKQSLNSKHQQNIGTYVWGKPKSFLADYLSKKDARRQATEKLESKVRSLFGVRQTPLRAPLNSLASDKSLSEAAAKFELSPAPSNDK